MRNLHRAQVLLEAEQHRALTEIARREGWRVSDLVREILRQHLAQRDQEARLKRELEALEALAQIRKHLHIQCHPLTRDLHECALRWAERLDHGKTYDAHYLALAEQPQAHLWTADRRLANAARQVRIHWLHWVGEDRE